ncbi:MAG: hypothetical protein K6F78_09415 [Bacteroidaceae bacterium]|nr:hypothetical protein [Bacteroidaceae bacterium]
MKKFFGLKMALAVLAAGAFVSCSDSEAGDIYIPTPGGGTVDVKYPAPTYVVAGVVTDAEDGSALEGVAVSGAVTATTDATGFFTSGVKSEPINGVITFTKTGYATVNRAVAMAAVTTGTVSESLVVAMSTGTSPTIPEGITVAPYDPTAAPTPLPELAVAVPANALAALGVPVVNESDKDMDVLVPVDSFDLPYGAKMVAEKSEANALDAMKLWGLLTYGNDPTDPVVGFGKFAGVIPVRIPAGTKVGSMTFTPMMVIMLFIFEDEQDGTTSQFIVDIIESYNSTVDPVVDPHDPHNPHGNGNGGGGETSGV